MIALAVDYFHGRTVQIGREDQSLLVQSGVGIDIGARRDRRDRRGLVQHVAHHPTRIRVGIGTAARHVDLFDVRAQIQESLEALGHLIVQIRPEAVTVHFGRRVVAEEGFGLDLQVAALMQIGRVDEILDFFRPAADVHVDAGLGRVALDQLPIIVVVRIQILHLGRFLGIIRIVRIESFQRVGILGPGNFIEGSFFMVVSRSLIPQVDVFERGEALRFPRERGPALLEVQIELGLAGLSALGRDQDRSVGSAHAEYGRSRGVLQHGHVVHLVRAQVVHVVARHAVDQNQRTRAVDRSGTSKHQRRLVLTRLAASLLEGGQTRQASGQGRGEVRRRTLLELLGLNRRNRAGYRNFFLGSVGYDDDFVDVLRVVLKSYFQGCLVTDRYFLGVVAQIRKYEGGTGFDRELEMSLRIGRRAGSGVLDHDGHSYQRFARLIGNGTRNGLLGLLGG